MKGKISNTSNEKNFDVEVFDKPYTSVRRTLRASKSPDKHGLFDFIILGAGGVGLAAGMYAARLGLKTLILGYSHGSELPIGGVITTTNLVENYPGFIRLTGTELANKS